MSFRLVDRGWNAELSGAICADRSVVRIICPFIKFGVVERLLRNGIPDALQVITRFNLGDFYDGVSDISALRLLRNNGAQIRGVRGLHAKLYLFGACSAIVTSANLTDAALLRNHEFGFVADDAEIVNQCRDYFDHIWQRAGNDLNNDQLDEWEQRVTACMASAVFSSAAAGLGDEGTDANIPPQPTESPVRIADAPQAFVKFFGMNSNRANRAMEVFEEVRRSGCHWACTYPKEKRPRIVRDGAIMFMGRMVEEPNDILIYGRAMGLRYVRGRDDATASDCEVRPFKEKWPHYIRVHHPEFIAGSLLNGISLNELMERFGSDAFPSTMRNAANGDGNTDPRKAYMQKAAVELSHNATEWLNEQLERAFELHGKIPADAIDQLDKPEILIAQHDEAVD